MGWAESGPENTIGWVPGEGDPTSPITWVGEAPAKEEVRAKRPFVGPSGNVLWQMAARYAGLQRRGSYITNWCKVQLSKDDKKRMEKNPEEVQEWTDILESELQGSSLVVALGGYATRALLGETYNLFWANGVPIRREDGKVVIPVVHPAAGIHEPTMLAKTAEGLKGVKGYLNGTILPRPVNFWRQVEPTQVLEGEWSLPSVEPNEVAIDTEGSTAEPYSLQFSTSYGTFLIWASDKQSVASFKRWLEENRPVIWLHYAVHDAAVMRAMGIDIWSYTVRDTMLMAHILQDLPRGLKDLGQKELGVRMLDYEEIVEPYRQVADDRWREDAYIQALLATKSVVQLTPKGKVRMSKGSPVTKLEGPVLQLGIIKHFQREQKFSPVEEKWAERAVGPRPGLDLRLVPTEIAIAYAGKDATVTRDLSSLLEGRIDSEGLDQVSDLDHSLLPMIDDMERVGMHLDIDRYWEVMNDVTTAKLRLLAELREITENPEFNPGSGLQVAEFCDHVYQTEGKLLLTKLTKGRTRVSTEENVLAQLRDDHPFISKELEWREYDKYETSYLLPMREDITQVEGGHRMYHRLNYIKVVSGRLAGRVLTWPAKTELGLSLRSVFTAPPGKIMVSWDLSQIELRIAAAFARDEVMMRAFTRGLDLHKNLASELFGTPYDQVIKTQRDSAKTIHYLLLYGGGGDKMFEELVARGVTAFSRNDCWRLIEETWQVYSGIAAYRDLAAEEGRRQGYVTDFLGRRRFLPGLQLTGEWPMKSLRREAERHALSLKIQGGATEIIKRAQRVVWEELLPEVQHTGLRFWLQVHDELMGEMYPEHFPEIDRRMKEILGMDSWLTDPVAIVAEGKQGAHWGELK